jgi:hypothetical protein
MLLLIKRQERQERAAKEAEVKAELERKAREYT